MATHPNPIALKAVREILSAARDLTFDLEGEPVTVQVERVGVPWPQPLDGLDEAKHGPWPPEVRVHASWAGGAAELVLRTFWWTAQGPYHHLIGITARAPNTRTSVAWVTFGIPIQTTLPEGVAEVFADISFQRHKKNGETEVEWSRRREALRWAARAVGLDTLPPPQVDTIR